MGPTHHSVVVHACTFQKASYFIFGLLSFCRLTAHFLVVPYTLHTAGALPIPHVLLLCFPPAETPRPVQKAHQRSARFAAVPEAFLEDPRTGEHE